MNQHKWMKTIACALSVSMLCGSFVAPAMAVESTDNETTDFAAESLERYLEQNNIDANGRIQDDTAQEHIPDDIAPKSTVTNDELDARNQETFVDSTYEPIESQALPNEKYSNIPLIGKGLNALTSNNTNAGHMDFDPSGDKPEGDGTTIEKIAVKWLNTDKSRWTTDTWSNMPLTFGARVDFSLSGEHAYLPGQVEIVMPLNIFTDRFGKDEGSLDVSLPQDPAYGATFTYKRIDDTIVVSNTAQIPAGYQGYFEVYWDSVVPAELVSCSVSDPFGARLSVVTHGDDG